MEKEEKSYLSDDHDTTSDTVSRKGEIRFSAEVTCRTIILPFTNV
jgi:hypothetical protein